MKWVIDMPDDWKNNCETCPHTEHQGDEEDGTAERIYNCQADFKKCPLANAKKAEEAIKDKGVEYYCGSSGSGWRVNGKPVKLYAVEIKEGV
jgi:hypothetical protein